MSAVIHHSFRIWATHLYSPVEISITLKELNVSHSLATNKLKRERVVNMKRAQPRWVRIINDLTKAKAEDYNIFCASMSELELTNIPLIPKLELNLALQSVLQSEKLTKVDQRKLNPLDYVDLVAKPSLLNKIQTEVYKIQPYSLRKQVQSSILGFFNSTMSEHKLLNFLKRSYKTEGLIELIKQGHNLRDAVTRLRNGYESVEVIATDTNIPTFELLYLNRK